MNKLEKQKVWNIIKRDGARAVEKKLISFLVDDDWSLDMFNDPDSALYVNFMLYRNASDGDDRQAITSFILYYLSTGDKLFLKKQKGPRKL